MAVLSIGRSRMQTRLRRIKVSAQFVDRESRCDIFIAFAGNRKEIYTSGGAAAYLKSFDGLISR